VWLPELNVVEVAVTFQPAPDPVASPIEKASVAVIVWLAPLSVVDGNVIVVLGVPLMNERVPAASVTDATVPARAGPGVAAAPAMTSAEMVAPRPRWVRLAVTGPRC
jgi:hypothetical protein